jgi:hypothetical protein
MTYHVYYGDTAAMSNRDHHLDERVQAERFSTEHEALNRAREILEADDCTAISIRDAAGNQLTGLRLQLRLGYLCE